MKKDLKSLAYMLLCFALGVALAEAFIHLRHPSPKNPPTSRALGDAPPLHGFLLQKPPSLAALDALAPLHATAIAIPFPNDPRSLSSLVEHAHTLGYKVILLPPTNFSEKNPFPQPLPTIADDAQAAHADILCLSWLNSDPDPDYWQPLIADLRKHFTGQLILAATPDILPGIEFWNSVDYLGVIGPFQLPIRTPSLAHPLILQDLRTAWACSLDSIESLSHRYGKKAILFDLPAPTPPALASQSNFVPLNYEALVTETKGRDATEGVFLVQPESAHPADPTLPAAYPDCLTRIAELWSPQRPDTSSRHRPRR